MRIVPTITDPQSLLDGTHYTVPRHSIARHVQSAHAHRRPHLHEEPARVGGREADGEQTVKKFGTVQSSEVLRTGLNQVHRVIYA